MNVQNLKPFLHEMIWEVIWGSISKSKMRVLLYASVNHETSLLCILGYLKLQSSYLDKSLTWHMNSGMTLWKIESRSPNPFSPVQRARKFSAVLGTIWEKSSIVMVPSGWPSAATVRNTCGLVSLECSWTLDMCGEEMHEASVWPMRLWHSQKVFLKDSAISGVLNLAASCSTKPSPSDGEKRRPSERIMGKLRHTRRLV